MDCPFCDVLINKKERVIRESQFCFIVLSDPKLMSGHFLVIPKRHVDKPSELSKEEREDWFNEIIKLQDEVLEKISPGCDISEHFRPFIPSGPLKVSHLHMHVRPRTLDDELYKKVQIYEKDVFKKITQDEVDVYKKILNP